MQLYINTYGTYLHIKDDMFEIKCRKDAEIEKVVYSPKKIETILLSPGTALSTDAVKLAMMNNVDIVFLENYGKPIGRVWHSKLGSTSKIRKAQLEASVNQLGLQWIKEWIGTKIDNQARFIKDLKKHRKHYEEYLDDKTERIENLKKSVQNLEASKVADVADTIRGLEGTAGRLYFETLSYVLPDENKFDGRSSRPAQDPYNAFLNYAYGILYSKIEKTLIIAGLDPYLGFLHRDDYNQLSMVFDYIEPYRIFAETVVFRLFTAKKVNQQHTDQMETGYSLNKSGKELLVMAFTTYFDEEKVLYKGRKQSRTNIIQADAHQFANSLIK